MLSKRPTDLHFFTTGLTHSLLDVVPSSTLILEWKLVVLKLQNNFIVKTKILPLIFKMAVVEDVLFFSSVLRLYYELTSLSRSIDFNEKSWVGSEIPQNTVGPAYVKVVLNWALNKHR